LREEYTRGVCMRIHRFQQLLKETINNNKPDVLDSVRTFEEAGYTDKPAGLVLAFTTGAQFYIQVVRSSVPGGDDPSKEEKIVEKEAPPAIPMPPLAYQGSKVRTRDIEQFIKAAIINSGSKEVAEVEAYSDRDNSAFYRYGLTVKFHSGAAVYILFVHTIPAGRELKKESEYQPLDEV